MFLSNLISRVRYWFQSERDYVEDKVMLESLLSESKLDEAQAYAYVLSSIASADGQYDAAERKLVSNILNEIFPGRKADIGHLISNAENMIANFRSSESYVARIKEEYSEEERQKLYNAIDQVIGSDGVNHEAEAYLREKFRKALL